MNSRYISQGFNNIVHDSLSYRRAQLKSGDIQKYLMQESVVYQAIMFSDGKSLILLFKNCLDNIDDRKGHVVREIFFLPVPGLAVSKVRQENCFQSLKIYSI